MTAKYVDRQLCDRPVVVTDDVYWWLTRRRVFLRVHSIDEVLRIEIPDMTAEIGDVPIREVRTFSDEGPIYASSYRIRRRNTTELVKK